MAEREHSVAAAVAAPLEATLAALVAKLDAAVGTTKLGSSVQLDDIDAMLKREQEQAPLLEAARARLKEIGDISERFAVQRKHAMEVRWSTGLWCPVVWSFWCCAAALVRRA